MPVLGWRRRAGKLAAASLAGVSPDGPGWVKRGISATKTEGCEPVPRPSLLLYTLAQNCPGCEHLPLVLNRQQWQQKAAFTPLRTEAFPFQFSPVRRPRFEGERLKKRACELPADSIPAASFVTPPFAPPHTRPLEEKAEKLRNDRNPLTARSAWRGAERLTCAQLYNQGRGGGVRDPPSASTLVACRGAHL